ncbi:MAG: TolC family protein [Candidatus Syntrophosphaera sp.]|nr:TolC family protein [Candidatus Syntrophosphaera sp.]
MKPTVIIMMLWATISLSLGIDLEQSIDLARENNKALLMAREEVLKADQTYKDVRGNLFPQLKLVGGYQLAKTYLPDSALPSPMNFSLGLDSLATYNDHYLAGSLSGIVNSLIPSSPMNEGSLGLSLQLDQVLFTGGKLLNGVRSVDRFRAIQRLNYQLKEQDVVLNTAKMFYACLLSEKFVDVQTEALGTARLHLTRVDSFAEEGMVSEFDLLRARLEIAKLEPQMVQAENTYQLALAAFRTQIGAPASDLVPEGTFVLPPELDITLEEALRQGTENRLELQMAEIATQVAELQWKTEKGNFLPNLGLQASASLYTAADEFAIVKDDFGSNYSVGLGISVPLFTGFSNAAKRSAARHDYQYAKLQQQDYEDLIRLEITQNYQKLRHAEENLRVQAQNIQMAERGLQLAQIRYENQMGIQLEVFDALTTLSAIKLQYFQAIYEVISATRELQRALGIRL